MSEPLQNHLGLLLLCAPMTGLKTQWLASQSEEMDPGPGTAPGHFSLAAKKML